MNSNRSRAAEPCAPYDTRPSGDPVDIWAVIDRLAPAEQRRMVMAFAIGDPRRFEDKLRRIWAERRAAEGARP